MKLNKIIWRVLLYVSAIFFFVVGFCQAQTNSIQVASVPQLQIEQLTSFSSAWTHLAGIGKVAFVIEGKPYHLALSPSAKETLNQELLACKDYDAIVRLVAKVYDYSVENPDKTLYVLKKRFSDPQDLPDVTLEEVTESLKRIATALDELNPKLSDDVEYQKQIARFVLSLTDEQNSGKPFPYSSLSAEQQQSLQTLIRYQYLQKALDVVQRTQSHLKAAQSPRSKFRYMNFLGQDVIVFGYDGPFDPNGYPAQYILSHGFSHRPGEVNVRSFSREILAVGIVTDKPLDVDEKRLKAFKEKLTDTFIVEPEEREALLRPSPAISLKTVVDSINDRSKEKQATVATFVPVLVDQKIQNKPVCLFGWEYSGNAELLKGLATVYGLVLETEKEAIALRLRSHKRIQDYRQVAEVVRYLIPEPLMRSSDAAFPRFQELEAKERDNSKFPEQIKELMKRNSMNRATVGRLGKLMLPTAVIAQRRLRILTEPKVKSEQDKRYWMANMEEDEKRFFTLMCFPKAMGELEHLLSISVPKTLYDTSKTIVVSKFPLDQPNGGLSVFRRGENENTIEEYSETIENPRFQRDNSSGKKPKPITLPLPE